MIEKMFRLFGNSCIVISVIFTTIILLHLGICSLNEFVIHSNYISYCQIVNAGVPLDNTNNMQISSEYKLMGIRNWRFTNTVVGIYPSAKSAFDAAQTMNCPVEK